MTTLTEKTEEIQLFEAMCPLGSTVKAKINGYMAVQDVKVDSLVFCLDGKLAFLGQYGRVYSVPVLVDDVLLPAADVFAHMLKMEVCDE